MGRNLWRLQLQAQKWGSMETHDLKAFAQNLPPHLSEVSLNFNDTPLSDDGLRVLGTYLPAHLEKIDLTVDRTAVSDEGQKMAERVRIRDWAKSEFGPKAKRRFW